MSPTLKPCFYRLQVKTTHVLGVLVFGLVVVFITLSSTLLKCGNGMPDPHLSFYVNLTVLKTSMIIALKLEF